MRGLQISLPALCPILLNTEHCYTVKNHGPCHNLPNLSSLSQHSQLPSSTIPLIIIFLFWTEVEFVQCPCRQCRRQCKIFASGVNFSIFTHFLCFFPLKLLKLGEIDGVKFLAWKSGGVIFFDKFHVCYNMWKAVSGFQLIVWKIATGNLPSPIAESAGSKCKFARSVSEQTRPYIGTFN